MRQRKVEWVDMADYQIEWYNDVYFDEWDMFIQEKSVNGTMLQTRKFLSYHPKERFKDCSVVVKMKGTIVAVCPACELTEDGKKVFMSHGGSTYGGLIVSLGVCKIEKMDQLIKAVEHFLLDAGFSKIIYKQTPDLLSESKNDLLYFCLQYEGYEEQQELNLYIDFEKYSEQIIKNFYKGRRSCVKSCMSRGMELKELQSKEEFGKFHQILKENLKKHGKSPVHTVEELLLLKAILKDEIEFWYVEFEGRMAAGAMVFCFHKVKCMHTHYLAADLQLDEYSPMSFLYYSMIDHAMHQGYRKVSWGIATDHDGNVNWNLSKTKESYGSIHEINRTYVKAV